MMKKCVFLVLATLGIYGFFVGALRAQTPQADELYARGLYLFFNDRYAEAEPLFRQGAELAPENPALFYFLGLSQGRLGESDEAHRSFTKGAEAELTPRGRLVDVSGHLRRIQGNERLALEDIRREVHRAAQERERRLNEAIYGNELLQQRRRLTASLASGKAAAPPAIPSGNLPSVPPIRPLLTTEINGYISEELANADREGFINLQKHERLDESGNVIKVEYLSTEAQKRAERRRTIAEERRIARETFVDIFDIENTSSDSTVFGGEKAADTPANPRK
ncbi:MAG: tetratricopeptide repeat protein [Thermoguttaceae bacterium]|jgi:tetratricopeptide (TPR) repeat protein